MTKLESGRFEMGIQRYVDDKVDDIRRAVDKAETSMSERLTILNEFRQTTDDNQKNFLTKAEYYAAHQRLCEDIEEMKRSQNKLLTREEYVPNYDALSKKLDDLQSLADVNRGKASMTSVYVAWLLGGISLIVSVIKLLK